METSNAHLIRAAQVVLPCGDLDATLAFFTERLGFRVEAIFPADDPMVAVIAAHGVRLRLERGAVGAPGVLRLLCSDPAALAGGDTVLTAPNGTRVELAPAEAPIVLPPIQQSFTLSRMTDDAQWKVGRAGMRYRDLIPDRQGGRFIASHICIPGGGPVPDYVHFHKVRFQMIYCRKGWARLVYEDQGEPFVLAAGDCVLQPPQIRHRVLESSPGLEVIEIGCPAEHETHADPGLALPTSALRPDRDFGGQRFVRHEAAKAIWQPWHLDGYECRDSGIGAATRGLAGARTVRPRVSAPPVMCSHDAEFLFWFVLDGGVTLQAEGRGAERLAAGDSVVVPAGMRHALAEPSPELELLEVTLPAEVEVAVEGGR
ncbi:MAG TPA: cupin domain-containing protein [Polyangia bacterium]|jgi:quercetin dioxygenase-like cupin family protein|nr:cupin domain-containing protein [Polyangia bacterium]